MNTKGAKKEMLRPGPRHVWTLQNHLILFYITLFPVYTFNKITNILINTLRIEEKLVKRISFYPDFTGIKLVWIKGKSQPKICLMPTSFAL